MTNKIRILVDCFLGISVVFLAKSVDPNIAVFESAMLFTSVVIAGTMIDIRKEVTDD